MYKLRIVKTGKYGRPQASRRQVRKASEAMGPDSCCFLPCPNSGNVHFRMTCSHGHGQVGIACWEHCAKAMLGKAVNCATCQVADNHICHVTVEFTRLVVSDG